MLLAIEGLDAGCGPGSRSGFPFALLGVPLILALLRVCVPEGFEEVGQLASLLCPCE